MITLDRVLDDIMMLDFTSREELVRILRKRQIEERRKEIARNAGKAKSQLRKGRIHATGANEAIHKLRAL